MKTYTNTVSELPLVDEPQIELRLRSSNQIFQKNKTFKIVSLFSGCGGLDLDF